MDSETDMVLKLLYPYSTFPFGVIPKNSRDIT